MSAIVKVENVEKCFLLPGTWPWSAKTEVHAVRGVSMEVQEGEVVALVGQSGSGKTTLSRMILGLEEPTTGSIHLDGMRWDGLSERVRNPHRLPYQYIPQDAMSALDPQQTALEAVSETLRVLRQLSREDALEEAKEMLSRLGLEQRYDALPREMSGGEQRRVTLARVLALKPRLVVADEPTSGLEPDRRESVLEDLVGNLSDGAGCVLVTHDMSAARRWADRVLVMLEGKIIEELDLRSEQPSHPYSRMLFDPWAFPIQRGAPTSTDSAAELVDATPASDEDKECQENATGLQEPHSTGDGDALGHTSEAESATLSDKGEPE